MAQWNEGVRKNTLVLTIAERMGSQWVASDATLQIAGG
jgi:hypothetical protein